MAPSKDTTSVNVELDAAQLAALDEAIADEGDKPSRPEMIRRMVTERLTVGGYLRIGRPGHSNTSDQDG